MATVNDDALAFIAFGISYRRDGWRRTAKTNPTDPSPPPSGTQSQKIAFFARGRGYCPIGERAFWGWSCSWGSGPSAYCHVFLRKIASLEFAMWLGATSVRAASQLRFRHSCVSLWTAFRAKRTEEDGHETWARYFLPYGAAHVSWLCWSDRLTVCQKKLWFEMDASPNLTRVIPSDKF